MSLSADFHSAFDEFWCRIDSGMPLALARYGDGEIALMKGLGVGPHTQAGAVDGWTAAAGETRLGTALAKSLYNDYIYGIPCQCCDPKGKAFLSSRISFGEVTYANLFVNANYERFLGKLAHLNGVNLLVNKSGYTKNYPFEVESEMFFENGCVQEWEYRSEEIKGRLTSMISGKKGELFLISVGPMSEAIIDHLWAVNRDNQYVDVGSALDTFVHGRKTRPYMMEGSPYHNRICSL